MPGGSIGGQGPIWQRAIWLFISCCIALAVWNGFVGGNPKDAWHKLENKSADVRDMAGRVVDTLGLNADKKTPTNQNKTPTKKPNHKKTNNR